ncbi:MAG: single-stranded DNA-binding protein [Flavobacteriales bacterium]|jgi:single-strand DNA-binding protein|nr:single-stranded DNA-binding protein [Flavobacteriales bacterium]|tara:strand:+ start:11764 stop:12261 length:498 start_codon:yes stop_codon:yes gene_type:complete
MAGSLNKVILIGNLGADPEIREMPDGTKMAKFSIATTERYKNREGEQVSNTEWHNIVLWRRTAEVAEKFLKKGDSVCIEGKLKTRSWEDEKGIKKYATDVQGDSMTMLGSKRDSSSNESNSYSPPQPSKQEEVSVQDSNQTPFSNHSGDNNNADPLPFEDEKIVN